MKYVGKFGDFTVYTDPSIPRDTFEVYPVGTPIPPPPYSSLRDVFSTSEGEAIFEWPREISESSYQDLVDWMEILKRKMKRSVKDLSPTVDRADGEVGGGSRIVDLEDKKDQG
jgi:hypothetical protein